MIYGFSSSEFPAQQIADLAHGLIFVHGIAQALHPLCQLFGWKLFESAGSKQRLAPSKRLIRLHTSIHHCCEVLEVHHIAFCMQLVQEIFQDFQGQRGTQRPEEGLANLERDSREMTLFYLKSIILIYVYMYLLIKRNT